MKRTFFALIIAFLFGWGCATGEEQPSDRRAFEVSQIQAGAIRIRRPLGEGADPKVGPGGVDYYSEVSPNARLDCQPVEALYTLDQLKGARKCLERLRGEGTYPTFIQYRLVRDAQPALVLEDDEKRLPSCVHQTLSSIPVPREIVFEVFDEQEELGKRRSCYASRLPVGADRILGAKLPIAQFVMRIRFPLEGSIDSDDDMLRTLVAWSLTPFFRAEKAPILESKYVPNFICETCFGEDFRKVPWQIQRELGWP